MSSQDQISVLFTEAEKPGATARIGIVDEDEGFCATLGTLLEQVSGTSYLGHYKRAENALETLPLKHPTLVIVELLLPRMRGSEFIWRLKQRVPDARALVLTADTCRISLFDALAAGADGYLQKPCAFAVLLQHIREISAGFTPLGEHARRALLKFFSCQGMKAFLVNQLSLRELRILRCLSWGLTTGEIATHLGIAPSTVHTHLIRIYQKLGVSNRVAATALIRDFLSSD